MRGPSKAPCDARARARTLLRRFMAKPLHVNVVENLWQHVLKKNPKWFDQQAPAPRHRPPFGVPHHLLSRTGVERWEGEGAACTALLASARALETGARPALSASTDRTGQRGPHSSHQRARPFILRTSIGMQSSPRPARRSTSRPRANNNDIPRAGEADSNYYVKPLMRAMGTGERGTGDWLFWGEGHMHVLRSAVRSCAWRFACTACELTLAVFASCFARMECLVRSFGVRRVCELCGYIMRPR
jgi:hypothetical protein